MIRVKWLECNLSLEPSLLLISSRLLLAQREWTRFFNHSETSNKERRLPSPMMVPQFFNQFTLTIQQLKFWLIFPEPKMKKLVMVPPPSLSLLVNSWEKLISLSKLRFIHKLSFKDGERLEKSPKKSWSIMPSITLKIQKLSRKILKILLWPPCPQSFWKLKDNNSLCWLLMPF